MGKKIDVDKFKNHMLNLADKAKDERNPELCASFLTAIKLVEEYANVFGEDA